ncbi:MAG: nitrilase family protein [Bacteroidales bacterium]|nr:nitrilase family protein [Bacteroidales bacterium]
MKIAIIQTEIKDFDVDHNYNNFYSLLKSVEEDTSLVLLPEMFLTGFVSDTSLAEQSKQKGLSLMRNFAKKKNTAVEGTLMIEENGQFFNRHYFIHPDVETFYDKVHLFSHSDEAFHFTKGEKKDVIVSYSDFNIKLLTCYDLRFCLSSLNRYSKEVFLYDILTYLASWPQMRREQWITLLKARAIENQAYVIGVNRIGKDGKGIEYSGNSCIINPKGEEESPIKIDNDSIFYYHIDKEKLNTFRQKFPVFHDWDKIKYRR